MEGVYAEHFGLRACGAPANGAVQHALPEDERARAEHNAPCVTGMSPDGPGQWLKFHIGGKATMGSPLKLTVP
jgi:hypothetical protein